MTQQEFVTKVAEMRLLQKEYFRNRDRSILDRCKFLEKEVDSAIAELSQMTKQTSLF